jgi:hypothetical protein
VLSATLFNDTFGTPEFDTANWSVVQNATIDDVAIDEPSAPYAARINGSTGAGDVLESAVIDLSDQASVKLTYLFQRGGGGNVVEIGNDLVLQYRHASGDWVELDRKLGSGTHMREFGHRTVALPTEALHANFQFRFMMTGRSTAIDTDDWFIDNVELRATEDGVGEPFTASITQTDNLYFPKVLHFDFTDLPAPGGDATLTLTAVGDLSSFLENLVLRADGTYIDQLFIAGGVDYAESTVTLILPQALMETLAADGTIRFTVTPSSLVSNTGPTSLTLELGYAGVPSNSDIDPPMVVSAELGENGKSFVVQFNDDDLDPIAAANVANYRIHRGNGDTNGDGDPFNDGDETEVAIESVTYDAESDQATVQARDRLFGGHFRLVLDGDDAVSDGTAGLADLAGNHLDGGDFVADFDRSVKTLLANLRDATEALALPRGLQRLVGRPIDTASHLVQRGFGNTRAVTVLLHTYIRRLDRALARGKLSEADHALLVRQTADVLAGLQENPMHGKHKWNWKWSWGKRRWGTFCRC